MESDKSVAASCVSDKTVVLKALRLLCFAADFRPFFTVFIPPALNRQLEPILMSGSAFMSVRCVLRWSLTRFFAVLLVTLAISPVTQPFSTLGISDFLVENAKSETDNGAATKDVATIIALVTPAGDGTARPNATVRPADRTIDHCGTPFVLRI